MLQEALKLLGLGAPVIYTAATFLLFRFLDKKASKQANRALAGWLRPLPYNKADVAAAIVEVFDQLYSKPLLTLEAFARSAIFSIVVTLGYATLEWYRSDYFFELDRTWTKMFIIGILFNVICDYVSLFSVRYCLVKMGRNPITALILGMCCGALIIYAVFCLRSYVLIGIKNREWDLFGPNWGLENYFYLDNYFYPHKDGLIRPAIIVHLWLPLLAVGVIGLKSASYFLWASGKAQWFLKQGQQHPLEAVGWVAAVVVFIVTAIIRVVSLGA